MDSQLIAAILYYVILYTGLSILCIPVLFFLLWTFFDFFKKHIWIFYVVLVSLFLVTILGFYFTKHLWTLWYYPLPAAIQFLGLLIIIAAGVIVKVAERTITLKVRFFYPLLKGERFILRTNGLYKYVRHPMYAVFPWVIFGAFLYTEQLILLVPFLFNLATRTWYAKKEEQHLKKIVIGDYDLFKKQTPNRFYPSFKKLK